ncbi:MAG: DNA-directed RNA polymerase subunit beta' [Chloroflexota bacterium]|nr:MAG: DNA-directed RNA polymerase subunit beta' [Chloroflexota bacterium]
MLEVNDFNAVRISLASPEQIKSWSYGEVTKPETINYRTLKPEKDGLFCEKIFGPTKDFECYCGKYKRVRYKGIVCDKCGVEVARSKVRRERLGHIDLASPAAHIWFVKGTPSRLGLLLDISPRSLERILYFAQYIITSVDEEAKRKLVQQYYDEANRELGRHEKTAHDKIAEINAKLEEHLDELHGRKEGELKRIEEELASAIDAVMEEATAREAFLREHLGQSAEEQIRFRDDVLVEQGAAINQLRLDALRELTQAIVAEVEARYREEQARARDLADADADQRRYAAEQEIERIERALLQEKDRVNGDLETRIDDTEDIKPLVLLTETKYRDLRDKYGSIFKAGMGAEAIREIVSGIELDQMRETLRKEINSSSGQRRKKATKRLRVVEAFRKSGNRPEWMIFTVLPVLPPELRPMVQLDGGRFATSDLNDLYRRVINRNNRLRRLLELGAPEIIIRNEKRMLQEAVDSLIDNGRRGRAVSGTRTNHKLKSLSDMLRGKQGRFRQNLLGKRVDYSGRSVIVVGPELQLHQCGLPKRMALELFKPFVMRKLVERGYVHNIKSAKRVVERLRPEVWDVLDEVVADRPVLLNRAPTLHRLGIQAFEPILIDGSAIQIHPLVCAAFNADFDGDQMAVHVPLSAQAVQEARSTMLSTFNLLLPSSGEPTVAPTLDMVLGCYYLTVARPDAKGTGKTFGSFEEAKLAYDLQQIDLQAVVKVRAIERPAQVGDGVTSAPFIETTVGRIIFNEVLPQELRFKNEVLDKKSLKGVVSECCRVLGNWETAKILDDIKRVGFEYATKSGITIAISDIRVPKAKAKLLEDADRRIAEIERQFRRGLITDDERRNSAVEIWTETSEAVATAVADSLDRYGPVYMMANSGAKGNISQIRQMAGMRGLMTDPTGTIIELPIRSSFREGLTVLEYFISTHGARKGLADTALRTADSGYLTRRLIDVAQDVIIIDDDCETTAGIWLSEPAEQGVSATLGERMLGRLAVADIVHPTTGEVLVERDQALDEERVKMVVAAGVKRVYVRSPLTCQSRRGVCQKCYGRDLARGRMVNKGEAVGIIAAQSIGEPGTQLTMRTFHTGGVASLGGRRYLEADITSGLPRVEELFEARVPKGQSIISEIDGTVEISRSEESRKVKIVSSEVYRDEYAIPSGFRVLVADGEPVEPGAVLAVPAAEAPVSGEKLPAIPEGAVIAKLGGRTEVEDGHVLIFYEEREEREYDIPATARLKVEDAQRVSAGDQLTEGSINPQDILRIMGSDAVKLYILDEVQKVYRSQGVTINDKHIETIVRQMLRKVAVDQPGDTELLPGELVDRFTYEDINAKVLAEGGEPATAQTVLLGVTKASLNTESFLAAASFQETTRVLTEAAINGTIDRLVGLKENVIIGKLIPAGTGVAARQEKRALPPRSLDNILA